MENELRQRLSELRVLSQNLRSCTEADSRPDAHLIKAILNITSSAPPLDMLSSRANSTANCRPSPLTPGSSRVVSKSQSTSSLAHQKSQPQLHKGDEQIEPLFPENRFKMYSGVDTLALQEDEILRLQAQNSRLQECLEEVRASVEFYKERLQEVQYKLMKSQKAKKQLHNQLQEQLDHPCFSMCARVRCRISPRASQQQQQKEWVDDVTLSRQKLQIRQADMQWRLVDAANVEYSDETALTLTFNTDQPVKLGLVFENIGQRQKWQLGLLINHQICLNSDRERPLSDFFSKSQKQLQKQALTKYMENKKKLIESKNQLNEIMLQKVSQIKNKKQFSSLVESEIYEEQQVGGQKISQNASLSSRQPGPSSEKALTQALVAEKNREEIALDKLKKGFYFVKYSKSGFNSHEKKVFLSQDGLKLCWQQPKSDQVKSIFIKQIESIMRGQIGPGIDKHIGRKNVQDYRLFAVIHCSNKDKKTLQFGAPELTMMDSFVESLTIAVNYAKKH